MIPRVGGLRRRQQAALLLAVGAMAGCTSTHAAAPGGGTVSRATASARATPTRAVLQLRATKSFSYRVGGRAPVHADATRPAVAKDVTGSRVDSFDEVTLLFPRPPFAANCVVQARLALRGVSVPGEPADLGVFPSAAFGFATGQSPEAPDELLDNQPAGHATATRGSGSIEVDVTSLVRTWLQGTFPSLAKRVPRSLPVLLTVQPPDRTEGRYSMTFAGVMTARAPVLVIDHRC
jgi:hypothetical protein